jgi:hypothetical protein
VAEGGALLRRYTAYTRIEGSNPSLSASPRKGPPEGPFFLGWRRERVETPRGSTSEHCSRRTLPRSGGGPGTQSRDERIARRRDVHNPSLGTLPLSLLPSGSVFVWRRDEGENPRGSTSEHCSRRTLPRGDGGPGTKSRDERIAPRRDVHNPSLGKVTSLH